MFQRQSLVMCLIDSGYLYTYNVGSRANAPCVMRLRREAEAGDGARCDILTLDERVAVGSLSGRF